VAGGNGEWMRPDDLVAPACFLCRTSKLDQQSGYRLEWIRSRALSQVFVDRFVLLDTEEDSPVPCLIEELQ
jgi:hypothetical protein